MEEQEAEEKSISFILYESNEDGKTDASDMEVNINVENESRTQCCSTRIILGELKYVQ